MFRSLYMWVGTAFGLYTPKKCLDKSGVCLRSLYTDSALANDGNVAGVSRVYLSLHVELNDGL